MKECVRCRQTLPTASFRTHPTNGDGRQAYCVACQREKNREWRLANPDKIKAANRARYVKEIEASGRRASKNVAPEARRAHHEVERAVVKGTLARPPCCSRCGSADRAIHAHHEDYGRPLDVTWLCAPCHGEVHAHRRVA